MSTSTLTDTEQYKRLIVSVRTPLERKLVEALVQLSQRIDALETRARRPTWSTGRRTPR